MLVKISSFGERRFHSEIHFFRHALVFIYHPRYEDDPQYGLRRVIMHGCYN